MSLTSGRVHTALVAAFACLASASALADARIVSPGAAAEAREPRVVVIPIHGEIDGVLAMTVKRRVDEVLAGGKPEVVVLDMDTWGGELGAAFDMAEQADRLDAAGIPTVAYVSKKAISAGALISLAARRIAMREGTLLGDCEPILVTGEGIETGPEKIQTVLRERFESYAKRNGYPRALARAMVTKGPAVHRVRFQKEDAAEAEVRYLDDAELEALPRLGGGHQVEEPPVVRKDQLLTMDAEKAKDFGFARFVVSSRDELVRTLEQESGRALEVSVLEVTWWESFIGFINSSEVKAILIMIGILGILAELKAPGLIVPGAIGLTAFALAFFGGYLAGLANVIEVVLVLVGIALLLIEIFILPGFGVVGLLGIVSVTAGLLLSLQSFTLPGLPGGPTTPWEIGEFKRNIFTLVAAVALAGLAFAALLRVLPQTRLASRIVLTSEQRPEDGYTVASSARIALLGKHGVAATPLRPAGRVEIDGEPVDAVAEGELIEQGAPVTVIETDDNRVVVRRSGPGAGTGA